MYDDSDLFGPIIFCLAFGTFLLLSGKVHFGYIYGLGLIGSVSLHWIFSLMSNPQLDSASNMGPSYDTNMNMGGYGAPMGNMGSMSGGGGGPLVAYPLMLFYVGFGIMGIFSSRGSGQLAARANL